MAAIALTFVIGHPLGFAPAVQASAPIASTQPLIVWTTGQQPGGSQAPQAPGGLTPPVIS